MLNPPRFFDRQVTTDPFLKPRAKAPEGAKPLQIRKGHNDVKVEQTFLKLLAPQHDPVELMSFQQDEEDFLTKFRAIEYNNRELQADRHLIESQQVIDEQNRILVKQYDEFQAKLDRVPFLKPTQRAELETQFIGELVKTSDMLGETDVYRDSKTGQPVEGGYSELQRAIQEAVGDVSTTANLEQPFSDIQDEQTRGTEPALLSPPRASPPISQRGNTRQNTRASPAVTRARGALRQTQLGIDYFSPQRR